MVDTLFQGASGHGGTHNAILSSEEYLSQAQRSLNNIEDGFYIAPGFLDKISIHIAKNFLDLPKIKVPLILGTLAPQTLRGTYPLSSSCPGKLDNPANKYRWICLSYCL